MVIFKIKLQKMKKTLFPFILIIFLLTNINSNAFAQKTDVFTDARDGKAYKTVSIGNQLWMAENLAFKTDSGCWTYDDEKNATEYGYLYYWETAKKVCPLASGWRLPTKKDFEVLLNNYGGKSNQETNYIALIPGGNSGFLASTGGWYCGFYSFIGKNGAFWSSSAKDDTYAWKLTVFNKYKEVEINSEPKSWGFSVRCIKNN